MAVPAQIAVLLALTADLFDDVPLDRMTDAEQAVRKAAAEIPAKVCERLDTAEQLSDEDRETIVEIARKSLEGFQPEPEVSTVVKPEPEPEPEEESCATPRRVSAERSAVPEISNPSSAR